MISVLTAAVLLSSGAAMAETTNSAAPSAKPAVVATHAKAKSQHVATVQSDKSKKCSANADAKNLHGKERKSFRHACMKAA